MTRQRHFGRNRRSTLHQRAAWLRAIAAAIADAAEELAQTISQDAGKPIRAARFGAQSLGQAEQQWLQQTMMSAAVALQTSEIALQKAEEDDVKQFAKFEADEQKGLAGACHV